MTIVFLSIYLRETPTSVRKDEGVTEMLSVLFVSKKNKPNDLNVNQYNSSEYILVYL